MITREQAREIAERFIRERAPLPGWDGVDRVLSPDEVAPEPPLLGEIKSQDAHWRHCWAVQVRGEAGGVVYVAREDGTIRFAGAVRGEPGPRSG